MAVESRNWHPEHIPGGIALGEDYQTTRRIVMINPTEKTYHARYGSKTSNSYVLWFGAYGCTRLHVYARRLEDALEECAGWLLEHAPGLITPEGSDEHKEWIKDACEARDVSYPEGFEALEDEQKWEICEEAETDQTRTESGFIASWEWGLCLENPTTAELYAFVRGK
jgi:hypothetical protein